MSNPRLNRWFPVLVGLILMTAGGAALAHGVAAGDSAFLEEVHGRWITPFVYLGAKHMVTGYDHLLFLFGVIFFLYRMTDVGIYVTLFAVGHSITLLLGVLGGYHFNPYIIDAIIGLSVVYKAMENLNGFQKLFGVQPNTRAAVFVFGLFHGLGLATKLQDVALSSDGLIPNMIGFNVGVELGQLVALAIMLVFINFWRSSDSFYRYANISNVILMTAGFLLTGYQLSGYLLSEGFV